LSGMSTTVVMPPDAAARVPVQKPSQSVRPGSLRCTCALETHEAVSLGKQSAQDSRETDVLDESRKEILVADVYPAILVVCNVRVVCVVSSDVSSLLDIDYFACLGGD
jgi:hypothetical protein